MKVDTAASLRRKGVSYLTQVEPCGLSCDAIEDYAAQVGTLVKRKAGDDVGKLIARLNGRVHYAEVDEWLVESGSIFVHNPYDFDVLLASYTSARRDQFTLAHELGHYFLHSRQGELPIIARRSGVSEVSEWEANIFAAAFLMPSQEFKKLLEFTKDPDVLAQHFNVSSDAARVRKQQLAKKQ